MGRLRLTASAVAFATVAILTVGLARAGPQPPFHLVIAGFFVVSIVTPTAIGLLIVLRKPRNVVAWVLLLGALSTAPGDALLPSHNAWALQWGRASWPLIYAWPVAVAFVFPDGRLLSQRWRRIAAATAFCFVAFITFAMLDPEPYDPPDQKVHNPLSGLHIPVWISWIWVPLWIGILSSLFVGAYAVRVRLRRSRGVERLQTLWLAWSAALIPAGLVWCGILGFLAPVAFPGAVGSLADNLLFPFLLVMETAVAVSVGIAVVRYRLYAIERLINRTLVYGTVTLVLAAAYAGVALGLGVAVGRGSDWATAAATLVVAIAFRPLRARVQTAVDSRFDRQRHAGVLAVEAFERDVRDGKRAPEEIGPVVAAALRDPLAELVFWLPASQAYARASGEMIAPLPEDGRARRMISHDGDRTAVLLHDPTLEERPTLLDDILRAAALSIEIARLRVEVRLQLQEVEASRARIVEAGYEERRRLERDLHDGAQQRLVSLGLRLRRMQRTLPREAQVLSPALDAIVDEVGSAIADLRQIAAGVRPARLDDGLSAALHDLARTAPLHVEVEANLPRVAASVEAAAYFVACEALTNAVKHASASRIAVSAMRENGSLRLTVSDDGVGGAILRRGSGLAGLKDRVAAHGGSFRVVSPDGGGTQLEVMLPCES